MTLRVLVVLVAALALAGASGAAIPPQRDPLPEISIADASTVETNFDTDGLLEVSLSTPTDDTVTVHWATANGTADATDYLPDSGTITFAPRRTSATVGVLIKGDALDEPDETVLVDLSDASFATIARARATLTIVDDPGDRGPSRVLAAAVAARWTVHRTYTTVRRLQVTRAPDGATVEVVCAGRGCPFKERTSGLTVGALRGAKLRPGTRVQVRIDAPGMIGRVFEYTIRASKQPRIRLLCFPPAAAKPARC
jgi:hypothetical protein